MSTPPTYFVSVAEKRTNLLGSTTTAATTNPEIQLGAAPSAFEASEIALEISHKPLAALLLPLWFSQVAKPSGEIASSYLQRTAQGVWAYPFGVSKADHQYAAREKLPLDNRLEIQSSFCPRDEFLSSTWMKMTLSGNLLEQFSLPLCCLSFVRRNQRKLFQNGKL